jgi:hypothetical protein
LDLGGIAIEGIASGQMNFGTEHYIILDNELHISWDKLDGLDLDPNHALFYLVADRNMENDYSSIGLASHHGTVFIGDDLIIRGIIWDTEMEEASTFESIQLGQNIPNPYVYKTRVPVSVTESGDFELEILDLTGHSFYRETIQISAGNTFIDIDADKIGIPAGVHTLSIKGTHELHQVKMIRLD